MIQRLLSWPARRPWSAVAIAAVLAILSALSTRRLRPDTSLQSLFSADDPAARALNRVLTNFPMAEEMLVLVTTPGDQPRTDQLLAFAARLEQRISNDSSAHQLVAAVRYRAGDQTREFVTKVIAPNGLFYLSDEEFSAARQRLTRAEMTEQFHRNEAMLAAPGPAAGALAKALLRDPLRLHEFIDKRLADSLPFKSYDGSDAFFSPDGRSLLIRIAGAKAVSDLEFSREITRVVTELATIANTDHLALEFSGAYPIAAQSERSIRRDSISSVIGSVACLLGLFVLAFRKPLALFAVTFLPVALGVLYGFGIYALFSRSVTPLTAVIGAVLAGIGIDYSIFYLVHYQERRSAGFDPVVAATDTIARIGAPLAAAWVTSVVGFIAIVFASVPALRDFSVVGSLGLAGALLGAMFLLPALLVLLDRWEACRVRFSGRNRSDWTASGSKAIPSAKADPANRETSRGAARLSMRPMLVWIDEHTHTCVIGSSTLMLMMVGYLSIAGPKLGLESDPTVLHPRPNPPLDAQLHIAERMGSSPDSLIVHLRADSPEKLLALAHRVNERFSNPAAREAGVASTFGIASLLPDPTVAPGRIEQTGAAMADRVTADFDAVVADSSFSPQAYEPYKSFLRTLLTPTAAPGVRELVAYPQLAETFLPRQAFSGPVPTEAMTLVFMKQATGERAIREASIARLRALLNDLPGATLTGMSVLSLDTEATIHRDLPRLILAAVTIIGIYLLLHFRSISHAMLAVLPTLCSLVSLLAAARLCGAKLNLANIVAIPLLIGIDVDYGIFLVSVSRRSATRAELLDRASASCRAVILCGSATLLGFGSLAFTSVPAVRSLGWAVAIGVTTCAVSSLFCLLPLLLWLKERSTMKMSGAAHVFATSVCVLALAVMTGGCSPPIGRLTFPTEPVDTTGDCEWYDVHHTGKREFGVAYDSNGQVDRLLYANRSSGGVDREYRLADYANERVPHLILLLDSIPFETMAERYDGGDFRWFGPPVKMIAPFPSLTEISYGDVLHAPPLPGVIDAYWDPRDEETKGILWDRVKGFEQPWERRLNYHANYMQQGLSFLHPDEWFTAELEQARLAVEKSPDRVSIVYIASAASMVCKYGKPGAQRVLDGAKQLCLQLLYERRGAIKISMMADHGHNYVLSKNVFLQKFLTEAGFYPAEKVGGDKDCVIEINALVTTAGIHTREPAQVAAALCKHEQVEVAIYEEGARAIIRTAAGTAAVECRDGKLRYIPLDADVLGYAALIEQLRAEGAMDADGFTDDEVWFQRTLDHPWPNAPRRVWDALHGRFLNPPTVILSIKDGFYAGYPHYEKYIKMASTHGGLNQINSATFVMTMTGRLDKAVRHEDVIGTIEPGFEPRVRR